MDRCLSSPSSFGGDSIQSRLQSVGLLRLYRASVAAGLFISGPLFRVIIIAAAREVVRAQSRNTGANT